MSSARFIVGDVRKVLQTLPERSVHLVLTSPPFLAKRAYLPADHPDKGDEIGTERSPGEFVDSLLHVVELCARVLADDGSMCFELGDTYAGSGGAGGDYNPGGLRDGQPRYKAATRSSQGTSRLIPPRRTMRPNGCDTHNAPAQSTPVVNGGPDWPLDRSLCLIPEIFRFALVYGFNPLTGRQTPRWRARNVVHWCRPNPPVGRDGDKFRPATSDMVVVCKDRRWFDLDAVRHPPLNGLDPSTPMGNGLYRGHPAGEQTGYPNRVSNPAGAPPLDYWVMATHPYPGAHYATWPPDLCVTPIKAMCPPGGTVLDPFAGSGTTLAVATGLGRDAIGIDIDAANIPLVEARVGMFLEVVQCPA